MITELGRIARLVLAALLLAAGAPVAMAQDDPPLRYSVKQGDTLYSLGQRYFSGRDAVERIRRLNRVSDPRRLPVGSILRIPRELARYERVSLRVQYFKGAVRVDGRAATVGAVVAEGDEIATGANAFVSFRSNDGSTMSMPSNSRARLVRARRYVLGEILDVDFAVLSGRGEIQAPKMRDQERYRVRTPVAVTAVRGTEFRVAHLEGEARSLTEVVEGEVAVSADEETALTSAGFGIASAPEGLGRQEKLLPIPAIKDAGAIQTGEAVRFAVELPDGAVGHRTQIATDAAFLDIVAERVEKSDEAVFEGIENRRYFVRARAISARGLEGLSEATPFRRKRLGVTPSVAESPLADGLLFAWLPEGEGKNYFAFQLWNEARPEALIVDEVGLDSSGIVLTDLEQGRYKWRVAVMQADSEDGLLKVWGPTQTLNVTE